MIDFERSALKIINTLIQNGYKAYYAGGCVRDKILGIPYKDIDIATSAHPDEVIKLFRKTVPVGIEYGVVLVLMDKIGFEVTTFRKDGTYKDGRHPDSIEYTNEQEDVLRRDFTINGLLYNPISNIILDFVDGQSDINNKLIRAIGDPYKRFNEDKLRMIRAIRFASRFEYNIEEHTWQAIKTLYKDISLVSPERIRDELFKILTQGHADRGIDLLDKSGLLKIILPEVVNLKGVQQPEEFHPEGDVYTHTILLLKHLNKPDKELALAALLHDIAKPVTMTHTDRIRFNGHDKKGAIMAKSICERLKLSNKETNHVVELVEQHMQFMNVQNMRESKLKRFLRQDLFKDHLELHRVDCLASHGKLDHYNFCVDKLNEFNKQEGNILYPEMLINGNSLLELGFKPGPIFKKILEDIENEQLERRIQSRDEAITYIKNNYITQKNINNRTG